MCVRSESEISVPIDISEAALIVASISSGRIAAKSVEAALVLKPMVRYSENERGGKVDYYPSVLRPLRMPGCLTGSSPSPENASRTIPTKNVNLPTAATKITKTDFYAHGVNVDLFVKIIE